MRRLIVLLSALALCTEFCTANVLTDFLSRLDTLRLSFDYSFEIKAQVPVTGEGTVMMQGNCYCLTSAGLRVWSGDSLRYMADDVVKELYIERVVDSDFNTNPLIYLKDIDGDRVVEGGIVLFDGRRVRSFSILPSDSSKFKSIKVFFSGKDMVGAEFLDTEGTRSVFKITNLSFHKDRLPSSAFSCELSEFKEYQIINMLSD